MWNPKNKIHKQTKLKQLIDAESRLVVARGVGVGALGGRGEGTKKHKSAVTEQSWGSK